MSEWIPLAHGEHPNVKAGTRVEYLFSDGGTILADYLIGPVTPTTTTGRPVIVGRAPTARSDWPIAYRLPKPDDTAIRSARMEQFRKFAEVNPADVRKVPVRETVKGAM